MRNPVPSLFIALLLGCGLAMAQSNISSGEIKGIVIDQSGAIVPGVTITATQLATGFTRQAISDERGGYRLLLLPPGMYDIRAEATGFKTQTSSSVEVLIGQVLSMDFKLQVGVAGETVMVTGEAPAIETQKARQSETISERSIRNLPIDRRDYLTFTLLAPGVVDSNALADNSDFRVTQTPQSGLSFYGSNGRGNSVTVDGAETNDSAGGVRSALSQEAIQEFQINRSNYSAELGGASGGVINIVSKSGGNQFHGRIFGFFRHDKLDAADPFAIALVSNKPQRVKPSAERQQYGGTLGFPLRKDRTFFFGGFEGLNRNESTTVPVLTDLSIFQPTAAQAAIIAGLAANPSMTPIVCLPSVPGAVTLPPAFCAGALQATLTAKQPTQDLFKTNSGVFPFTSNNKTFSARLDHRAGTSHQLFLRYNFARNRENNQSTRALVGLSRSNNTYILDSNVVGGWTAAVSPKLINEFHVQWNYRKFDVNPNDPFGPELNIAGFGFFNRDIFLPSYTFERRYEISDSLSYARGNHRFKFGGTLLLRGAKTDSHTFMGGRFGFGTLPGALVSPALGAAPITALQAFDLGVPQSYQQGFGDGVVAATMPYYAFYVQDSWSMAPNFTLDLGLRYEVDDRRDPIPTDKNNFAPRFGFAWDPFSNKKTVIRGGFGIYYATTYFQIDHVVNSLNEIGGFRQIAQVLSVLDATNPFAATGPINIYQTLRARGVIGVPKPTRAITAADLSQFGITISQTGPRPPFTVLFRVDPNHRNSYSQQGSLGIEQALGPGTSIGANYIFASTLKISRSRDLNLRDRPIGPRGIRDWSSTAGCTGAGILNCFKDPLLFQENMYESSARAFYHGMVLELSRRFSKNVVFAGNYTWSKAIDEVTDFNSDFQPMDQLNLRAERALSAFDQRHKLVVFAQLSSPFETGNSAIETFLSGFVLSPILRANSSRPFNLLTGTDLNGDRHSTTDRPIFAGRNTGIGPNFVTMDLRLARRFNLGSEKNVLELTFEGFNIFNRLNYSSVNNTVGPAFAGPFNVKARSDVGPSVPLAYTAAHDARRIQLGLRLSF